MVFFRNDDEEEEVEAETPDDEDAALADDVLDEVEGDDDVSTPDELEGFGLMDESAVPEDKEEENKDEDGDESLEDDAEDVDFDTFDDVDEM